MKKNYKYFMLVIISFMMATFAACTMDATNTDDPSNPNPPTNNDPPIEDIEKRKVTMIKVDWKGDEEFYYFNYDKKDRVKRITTIESDTEDSWYYIMDIDYSSQRIIKLTSGNEEIGYSDEYISLNDMGYIESYDEEEYTYDSNGYIKRITLEDYDSKVNFKWQNGNISRVDEEDNDDYGVTKSSYNFTYNTNKNSLTTIDLSYFVTYFCSEVWFPSGLGCIGLAGKSSTNYVTSIARKTNDSDGDSELYNVSFKWGYDEDGYPTICLISSEWIYDNQRESVEYTVEISYYDETGEVDPELPHGDTPTTTKLDTPELSETHTETSITVSWDAVKNAEIYTVYLAGKTYNTEACEYTFENLNAGKYTIRVGAKADGYEDSDLAKIEVTLTGATSVDWFTQTVSLPAVDETIDYGNGQVVVYQPYNGVKVLWKGTGVADIKYALFESATAEQFTDAEIKNKMNTFGDLAGALELINSEEGLKIIYGSCKANTTYTACVWVKNTEGTEFFTRNEITTADFDIPAETQAWIGTWNAKTSQILSMTISEAGGLLYDLSAQESNFTFTIAASTYGPDIVMIDGLSVLGEGYPTLGYITENTLEISTNLSLGYDANGYNYVWLPCVAVDGQVLGLNNFDGEVPAHTLTMAKDGTVTGETGKFAVRFNDGTEAEAEVVSTDVFALSPDGYLNFLGIEEFPAVYRAGAMEVTKAATPTAKVLNKPAKNYSLMNTSVVLR